MMQSTQHRLREHNNTLPSRWRDSSFRTVTNIARRIRDSSLNYITSWNAAMLMSQDLTEAMTVNHHA